MALIYPQNGDLKKLLKSARKKVPQSARLSAGGVGGGAKAKRAMPKCPRHEFEWGFPYMDGFTSEGAGDLEGNLNKPLESTKSICNP